MERDRCNVAVRNEVGVDVLTGEKVTAKSEGSSVTLDR